MANELERLRLALAERYRVEHEVGRGGMATVYRAHDVRHDRAVAVKVLRPELAGALGPERFLREIRLTARLDHPHIVPLLDSGEADGLLYYVMPYVEGESLRQRMNREAPVPLDEALQLAREVADALSHAHSFGIVHRDIKPENILLSAGHARVADFGIARAVEVAGGETTRLTVTGIAAGTPLYMSPEQAAGDPGVDPRTDVYSLGCVVYEMLAAQAAFAGATVNAVLARKSLEAVPSLRAARPGVPAGVDRAVTRALARSPADRFESAAQFAHALEQGTRRELLGPRFERFPYGRVLVGATAVLVVLAAGWWGASRRGSPQELSLQVTSLAVLPLDNLSGDATEDYLADGMTEALIAEIGKIGSLRVTPRPTVMRYKRTPGSLRNVARDLRVDALVTGSVRRSADQVGITVQLVDPEADRQIWSQTYERHIRDALALHSDVARALAREIRANVTPSEARRLDAARPVDPEAYELFLRARYLGDRTTESDMQAAIRQLERAVTLDPGFALAYAEMAAAYVRRLTFVAPDQAAELEQKAFAAAERAIALDADLADAYVARGDLLWTPAHRFPHQRAAQEFRKGLTLNPNLEHAHRGMSRVLVHVGFLEEGLEHANRAIEINPGNGFTLMMRVEALQWMGRYADALATLSSVPAAALPELREAYTVWSLFMLQRRDEAWSRLEEALRRHPNDASGNLASMQALLLSESDPRRAQVLISEVAKREPVNTSHHASYFVASAWARMGRAREAVEWLRETVETGFPCYPLFASDPNLDPIRQDRMFQALLADLEQNLAVLRRELFPQGS